MENFFLVLVSTVAALFISGSDGLALSKSTTIIIIVIIKLTFVY